MNKEKKSVALEGTAEFRSGVSSPALKIYRYDNDQYPFIIGVGRARLIVDNIDAIKAFFERHKYDGRGGSRR